MAERSSSAPISFQQRDLRAGQARIAYMVGGDGPALVLLHGLSGSTRWWRYNLQPLARRFRVYAVDLIGFGRSRGQRFVLREAPRLICDWMEGLGEERFHIIGHSMGGFIASSLGVQAPQRINRLVLVDALALPIGHSFVRSAVGLLEALPYLPPDFLPVLVTDALRAGPLTLLRAIHDIHRSDLTVELEQLQAETLIVWGEHDTLLPVRSGEALRSAMPKVRFEIVRGAGHNPMWDQPEAFNHLVMEFLSGEGVHGEQPA